VGYQFSDSPFFRVAVLEKSFAIDNGSVLLFLPERCLCGLWSDLDGRFEE